MRISETDPEGWIAWHACRTLLEQELVSFRRLAAVRASGLDAQTEQERAIDNLWTFSGEWETDSFAARLRDAAEQLVGTYGRLEEAKRLFDDLDEEIKAFAQTSADEAIKLDELFPQDLRWIAEGWESAWHEYLSIIDTVEEEASKLETDRARRFERDTAVAAAVEELNAERDRLREVLAAIQAEAGRLTAPSVGIVWNGTQEQLAYLLHGLLRAGFLGDVNLWALAERAFLRPDGTPFKRTSIKSAASKLGLNDGGQPSSAGDEIDQLIAGVLGLPAAR